MNSLADALNMYVHVCYNSEYVCVYINDFLQDYKNEITISKEFPTDRD